MFPSWVFAHIFLAAILAVRLIVWLILQNDLKLVFVGKVEDFVDIDGNASSEMSKVANIALEVERLFDKLLQDVGFSSVRNDEVALVEFVNESDSVLHCYFSFFI